MSASQIHELVEIAKELARRAPDLAERMLKVLEATPA
jgi:hypothetical protein